jgi:hypothetical protein
MLNIKPAFFALVKGDLLPSIQGGLFLKDPRGKQVPFDFHPITPFSALLLHPANSLFYNP